MKLFYRIILIIVILLGISYSVPALMMLQFIIADPMGWQAGISTNSTIVWAAAIVFGYGFLLLQIILYIFGIFFAFKSRRTAFWLLFLPGIFGIVSGLVWLGLFITFDAEWPSSWPFIAALLAPPLTALVIGTLIRRNLRKSTDTQSPVK